MADFILNRKISVDKYQFPEGAFKIYGSGKFYNGFSIGASTKLSVVNENGVLTFSRDAAEAQEVTSVILGTIPPNNKASIYIDIASPLPVPPSPGSGVTINGSNVYIPDWKEVKIYQTTGSWTTAKLQAGGTLALYFQGASDLPAMPNLCSVRAIWAL